MTLLLKILIMRNTTHVTKTIGAPYQDIWSKVSKMTDMEDILPDMVTSTEVSHEHGDVPTRVCTTHKGESINETIEMNGEILQGSIGIFQYYIREISMPLSNVLGTILVRKISDSETEVTWSANYDVEEDHAEAVRNMTKEAHETGINNLA